MISVGELPGHHDDVSCKACASWKLDVLWQENAVAVMRRWAPCRLCVLGYCEYVVSAAVYFILLNLHDLLIQAWPSGKAQSFQPGFEPQHDPTEFCPKFTFLRYHYYIVITSLLLIITNSILLIITSLLHHYNVIITPLLLHYYSLLLMCYYPLLQFHYYSLLHHYYTIITSLLRHYSHSYNVIITYYYTIITSLLRHYHVIITHYYNFIITHFFIIITSWLYHDYIIVF